MIYSFWKNTRTKIICNIQIRLFIQLRTIATCPLSPQETVWQFVIPAKSARGGREPGSRKNLTILNSTLDSPSIFAQGGEPVEPRISPEMTGSANCDIVSKGRTGFCGVKLMVVLGIEGFSDS